jgi:hypothetical protein
MHTVEDHLKLAIEFSKMELDRLRHGDWLNLIDDLLAC